MADKKNWLRLLAYVTDSINQELLLRTEYLAAENRILKSQIKGRLQLSDGERATLAEIAKRLGRKALEEIACIAKPDTILAWYRKLVAQKFDGSKNRGMAGRARVDPAVEEPVVNLARENSDWGYDRIVGALANLGHDISDQNVGNILRRHASGELSTLPPPRRGSHVDILQGTFLSRLDRHFYLVLTVYFADCWPEIPGRSAPLHGLGTFHALPVDHLQAGSRLSKC
jgi:hypothetical protein